MYTPWSIMCPIQFPKKLTKAYHPLITPKLMVMKGVDTIIKVGGGLVVMAREARGNFLPYCIQNLFKISILLLNISALVHFLAMQLS